MPHNADAELYASRKLSASDNAGQADAVLSILVAVCQVGFLGRRQVAILLRC